MVKKNSVLVPFSNFNLNVASALSMAGFLGPIVQKGRKPKVNLEISLKYDEKDNPSISSIKQISKSGQRIYKGYKDLPRVKNGRGIAVISTSHGILSDKEARKRKLGGEVICEVW